MTAVLVALFALTLAAAVIVARARRLFAAAMAASAFSLMSAALFQALDAADVAITEAAVGVGAGGIILLEALALTGARPVRRTPARRRLTAACALVALFGVLAWGMTGLPAVGDPQAPAHVFIGEPYLARAVADTGIPNVVTAVLASYRGFDTMGETFVILTAAAATLAALRVGPGVRPTRDERAHGLGDRIPPHIAMRVFVPLIVLFALYVQFHGDYSPGGGFQAGALLAAALALVLVVAGPNHAARLAPTAALVGAAGVGAALYAGVGFVGLFFGRAFLDYAPLGEGAAGQHLGVLLVEVGVGITVAGSIAAIFVAFAQRAFRTP